MAALARLDAPLALANAARWDDEALAPLRETLAPVLETAMGEGTVQPEQVAALTMLADDSGDVIADVLKQAGHAECSSFPALVEEAAYDVLFRNARRGRREVMRYIELARSHRPLVGLLASAGAVPGDPAPGADLG